MGGKRAAGKRGAATSEVAAPGGTAAAPRKRGRGGWPWWLWASSAFGILVCAGRLLAAPPRSPAPGKARSGAGASGTARMLELTLRLQEMTQVATALKASGELDSAAAHELDAELTAIEAEVQGADDKVMRDLLSVVSVVRGLLYQLGEGYSDEQVEGLPRASFTYASARYWDDYYNKTTEEERFDWYGTWDTAIEEVGPTGDRAAQQLGDLLRPYLSPDSKILMLGCGNSDMSEKIYQQGFQSIVNVDISERLLENLRARLGASMPRMSWQFANASALSFEDAVFDVIIDKGTFDAIEANKPLLQAAVLEAHRTLRSGGFLLSVTFNDAPTRVEDQLQQADWAACRTHAFDRSARKDDRSNGAEKSRYYMHACGRRE